MGRVGLDWVGLGWALPPSLAELPLHSSQVYPHDRLGYHHYHELPMTSSSRPRILRVGLDWIGLVWIALDWVGRD